MKSEHYFPYVRVERDGKGQPYEGTIGLKLKSIIKADLLQQRDVPYDHGMDENRSVNRNVQERRMLREAFLQALSGWPRDVLIELRVVAIPNIASRANGHLAIHMLIRASHQKKEVVREKVMSAFLSLNPILWSHVSEAEFLPVFNGKEIQFQLEPFSSRHAVFVGRREGMISLSTPMRQLSIGFGPQKYLEMERDDGVIKHIYPWCPSHDDWAVLLNTLMAQIDPTELIVRLNPRDPDEVMLERLSANLRTCEAFLEGLSEKESILKRQVQMIRDISLQHLSELASCCFNLGVYMVSEQPVDTVLANVAGRSITQSGTDGSEGNLFEGGFRVKAISPKLARSCKGRAEEHGFSLSEAACAFRLPDPPEDDIPGLALRRSRTNFAFLKTNKEIGSATTRLFINTHQGIKQEVFSTMEDRFRHMFIIGQTGTGKSSFMESLILQDIQAGLGIAVIDPHGELVEQILGKIPKSREKDVIFFNMLDRKRPMGFNVIQWQTVEERDLIIDELYLTLDRIYDLKLAGGPIFENNFRGMLKLLMGAKKTRDYVSTLLEFNLCYQEEGFRDWLKERTCDSQTLDFIKELEMTRGEGSINNISSYITSKFNRFVHDTTLRLIIGQGKISFDFEEVLNQRKILLVHLGKGRFGPNASALLANQLVSRFKNAAMKRGDIKPKEREPFFLYVDECHNLPSENFRELLSEARKFKMGLVLSTQYAGQIKNELSQSDLLSAILGNVGTIAAFRLGYDDALKMAQVFYPNFTFDDILGLPNWEGYARMQVNGEATPPFSFRTVLDPTIYSAQTAERIRKMSQKKYGCDALRAEESIERRRSVWQEEKNRKNDIEQIKEYYEAGEYQKARTLLQKMKHEVFDETPNFETMYPPSVISTLKNFDRLLEDKEGYNDDTPSFTGMAKEVIGANTGSFTVVGKEETMRFIYERDLLIQGDTEFSGREVTVYYDGPDAWDSHTALKIVVHPQDIAFQEV